MAHHVDPHGDSSPDAINPEIKKSKKTAPSLPVRLVRGGATLCVKIKIARKLVVSTPCPLILDLSSLNGAFIFNHYN